MAEVLAMPDARRRRLKELETVIASGWGEVVRVGQALQEISEDGLYLEVGAQTFEGYCRSRWSFAARTAYQYIDAVQVDEAVRAIARNTTINTEFVARELAPLLRRGGKPLVAEAWSKVADRFDGQRAPTAREVHEVLVEEGYRQRVIGPASGKVNRRIRLGQFGDKLIAAEKRLNWFATHELGDKPLAKRDRDLAARYADKLEAMAELLRTIAAGEVLE
jgi:hypothetical protein